ncbi:MAG: hypothetical protein U9Q07_13785 [Planctomycetota bacterium]|nr:hypothetical protein [Planctomycetota bacterium]
MGVLTLSALLNTLKIPVNGYAFANGQIYLPLCSFSACSNCHRDYKRAAGQNAAKNRGEIEEKSGVPSLLLSRIGPVQVLVKECERVADEKAKRIAGQWQAPSV